MNNKNTMGRLEFCVEHLIWSVLAFMWYRVIFRCIGDCSLAISRLVLFGSVVTVSVLFGVIEFRRARNGFSVFLNLVIGYGLYTVLAYMQFKKVLVQVSLLTAACLSVVCAVYIMTRRIRNKKIFKKIMVRRIHKSLLVIQSMLGLGMSVIVLVIGVGGIMGNSMLYSESVSFTQSDVEDQTLANNIETVALLDEARWKELSAQEKMEVLQVVANIEQRYLGLSHKLNVGATNLKEGIEDSYGYYMQACEEDARDYAKTAVEDYYEKINAFYGDEVIGVWNSGRNSYQMAYSVVYEADGYAYLENQDGDTIAGPYLYIEEGIEWAWDEACRYTGLNGLIGYLDTEGHEITEPKFMEASEMQDGKAMVSEKIGSVYYINSDGEKFTEDFMDGFPYEYQGRFARVLQADGWALIDQSGKNVFSGADSINELPTVTALGSAVREGRALMLNLDVAIGEEIQIIKEFDQFKDISYVYCASFAIVTSEDDLHGVVNYEGDLVIEPFYQAVDYEIIDDGDDSWYGDHIRFKLQNPDGTYVIKEIRL